MVEPVALSLALLSALIVIVSCEYSASECRSLGFNKANLLCSSCFYLAEHDLEVLVNQCRECCLQEGRNESSTLYPQAILEVSFIKSDKARGFPNLSIKYVRGADPIIKLLDADGAVQEELAIDKWNTDSVEEFLKMHLIMDHSSNDL
uniref:Selenoprotein F n=1 Tax=Daphnia galeata TaxID=27404 RepID=A0A8J2S8U8_9CRUS|nr:unnamed protein product [Daphnia galeata]